MADVKCKEPHCDCYISDPCIKVSGLFLTKIDLEESGGTDPFKDDKISTIDKILQNDLGLDNHQHLYTQFKADYRAFKKATVTGKTRFTLTCRLGHTHDYFITCSNP